jgi:hypothetical protein
MDTQAPVQFTVGKPARIEGGNLIIPLELGSKQLSKSKKNFLLYSTGKYFQPVDNLNIKVHVIKTNPEYKE